MKETIPLTKIAIAFLIVCSINIGICMVIAQQAYQKDEPYLIIAFLGISMMGLIKVIIRVSKRTAQN